MEDKESGRAVLPRRLVTRRGVGTRMVQSGLLGRAALLCLGLMVAGLVLHRLTRRFTRYEVQGESMLPALAPGDYLIIDRWAYASRPPRPGEIVLLCDPRDQDRVIIKRVRWTVPDGVWVEGDNAAASTDSRHFGPVGRQLLIGRMRWLYWHGGNKPA